MDYTRSSSTADAPHGGSASAACVLSVVVPLFNEEKGVQELVERIEAACRSVNVSFEIIVVNDGSRDGTLEHLITLSAKIRELRVIDLLRNFGHMPALSAGLSVATGEAVIVMDGDLQDPPEIIPDFYEHWRKGKHVVYGLRAARGESFIQRSLTHMFYGLLRSITRIEIPAQSGTFCLMDRTIVNALLSLPERQRFFAGLRAWAGGNQIAVSYDRPQRKFGKSRVGFRGLIRLARTGLVSFSQVPLMYASVCSLLAALLLFCIGVAAIAIRLFTNEAIPGWATFTTLIGFMGFMQSFLLSVLAEYIAVIFEEVKRRPLFFIRQEIRQGQPLSPS